MQERALALSRAGGGIMVYNEGRVQIIRRSSRSINATPEEAAPAATTAVVTGFTPMCACAKPHGISQAMLDY